jgi:hypothetical protein
MLVYHFKDRLSTLEKKSNTIVDIINNVVKELNIIKHQVITSNIITGSPIVPMNDAVSVSHMNRIEVIENDPDSDTNSYISESELDSDDDSTVYESSSESKGVEQESLNNEVQEPQSIVNGEPELSDNQEPDYENIKRININLSQNNISEDLGDILEVQNDDIDIEELPEEIELNENEPLLVINKLDESVNEPESNLEESQTNNQPDSEIYRKMEVGNLRALVISKGLASDTKKMKKQELIRLLETSEE